MPFPGFLGKSMILNAFGSRLSRRKSGNVNDGAAAVNTDHKGGGGFYADVFSWPADRRHGWRACDVPVSNQQNLTTSIRPFCAKKPAHRTVFFAQSSSGMARETRILLSAIQ